MPSRLTIDTEFGTVIVASALEVVMDPFVSLTSVGDLARWPSQLAAAHMCVDV